jgi:hypothetical protein
MAKKFLVPIDLSLLELRRFLVETIAGNPAELPTGRMWFDSTIGRLKFRNASATRTVLDDSHETGGTVHPAATTSVNGFMSSTDKTKLDGVAAGAQVNPVEISEGEITTGTGTDLRSITGRRAAFLTNRGNHTGTQLANTISNFDTQVRTSRLDQMAAPTAVVSLNSQRITNLATPTAATDAANKGYVDAAVEGLSWKQAVRVATTANITLSGTQTIDGVGVVANDRVLVKNQSTGAQNGIYVVAAGAWSRSADADAAEELRGAAVLVREGTTQADSKWLMTTDGTITLGTTALTWTQYSTGGGSSYFAAAPITLSGTTFGLSFGAGLANSGGALVVDSATVPTRLAQTIGNGTSTMITITHNKGTRDLIVQVFTEDTGEQVECRVLVTSAQVVLFFATAPAANSLRVVIL